MKTYIKIFVFLLFICSCNQKNISNNENYVNLDTVNIQETLLIYKNIICSDVYYKSLDKFNNKAKSEDLSRAYYAPFSKDLIFLMEYDKNRALLIEKWVNLNYDKFKEIDNISSKYPNGSLELIKTFDFYNSEDLKKHLDSISEIIKSKRKN
jgi:uncharacterized protein (UPF0332 family)